MTKQKQMLFLMKEWQKATSRVEIDMHEVAKFAQDKGWKLPPPISGLERLAKEFAQAAREETRQDEKSGKPYRVYHAFPSGKKQGEFLWIDIDDASRKIMSKSVAMRREQVVGDMTQLYLDLDHWNRVHPNDEPIRLVTDVTEDVNERLNGPEESAA